ncbi:hypothetical protein X965_07995 [Morganella sp. EGD-HP17]|nr:hypothetical protein X965_07995 [Morganella sp. EGD-HP17]
MTAKIRRVGDIKAIDLRKKSKDNEMRNDFFFIYLPGN